jgi:hypothetical protein
VSLAIILSIVLVMALVHGDDGNDPIQLIWMAAMWTLDAGTMGGDQGSAGFLFGMLAVTVAASSSSARSSGS